MALRGTDQITGQAFYGCDNFTYDDQMFPQVPPRLRRERGMPARWSFGVLLDAEPTARRLSDLLAALAGSLLYHH